MTVSINAWDVLKRPLITEKGTDRQAQLNQYTFEVALEANKNQIKEAVELAFKVTVTDVHTMNVRGKMRRVGRHKGYTHNWKKAIVTVQQGQTIGEFFEGV
jgi:large subunit ribosomal protein L23